MRKIISRSKGNAMFRRKARNIQSVNLAPVPMRGGFRI